jgi:hypothetical protein
MKKTVITAKIFEWAGRYLPAEIVGTVTAMAAALGVYEATGSLAAAALAGSVAEAVGFYGYFAARSGMQYYAKHRAHPRPRRLALAAMHTARDMLVEFGPAEAVDSFFTRPLFMYLGPQLLHNVGVGLLAGKLVADLLFYTLAATSYELKKYWLRTRKAKPLEVPADE